MRAVVQRVAKASVTADGKPAGSIDHGFMILLGVGDEDEQEDAEWLAGKIGSLRIFSDDEGKMNLDIKDVGGAALVVSQFTLHAKYKKGTRPSFIHAAHPDTAIPLYEHFCKALQIKVGKPVQTGEFGAHMEVELVNDGPVTIVLDTKNKE
jgi:D-tyrosyl-tRNA(Tyr) deacylase